MDKKKIAILAEQNAFFISPLLSLVMTINALRPIASEPMRRRALCEHR
jgi:hypothetical protein